MLLLAGMAAQCTHSVFNGCWIDCSPGAIVALMAQTSWLGQSWRRTIHSWKEDKIIGKPHLISIYTTKQNLVLHSFPFLNYIYITHLFHYGTQGSIQWISKRFPIQGSARSRPAYFQHGDCFRQVQTTLWVQDSTSLSALYWLHLPWPRHSLTCWARFTVRFPSSTSLRSIGTPGAWIFRAKHCTRKAKMPRKAWLRAQDSST